MKSLLGKLRVIFFIIVLMIIGYAEVLGVEGNDHASFRGLKGIYILIDGRFDEVIKEGVTKDQLKTDVELQLRKAGIKVLTEQEFVALPGAPYLSITLLTSEGACGGAGPISSRRVYAICTLIRLNQNAMLERNPKIKTNVVTWGCNIIAWDEAKNIKRIIREGVKDGIDRFMNDYLAVNPK
jgi:hypothetical protein